LSRPGGQQHRLACEKLDLNVEDRFFDTSLFQKPSGNPGQMELF
jgi:hypothetical protein